MNPYNANEQRYDEMTILGRLNDDILHTTVQSNHILSHSPSSLKDCLPYEVQCRRLWNS